MVPHVFLQFGIMNQKKICEGIGIAPNKVYECADAAYAMKVFNYESGSLALIQRGINPKEKLVAINVLNEIYEQYNYKENVAKICDYLVEKHGITPVFINHEVRPGMDQDATRKTIELVENKDKIRILSNEFYNPRVIVPILTNFLFTISMRMHLLILSAMAGIPFIGISRVDKVENLFKQVGLNTFTTIQGFDLKKMENDIDNIINNRSQFVEIVKKFVTHRRTVAYNNADILKNYFMTMK